jgi:hypothetical protein
MLRHNEYPDGSTAGHTKPAAAENFLSAASKRQPVFSLSIVGGAGSRMEGVPAGRPASTSSNYDDSEAASRED